MTTPAGTVVVRSRRADLLSAGALVVAACAILAARVGRRPDLIDQIDWVLGEHGNQLYRADLVREGRLIYRDFACQYGPLPTYLYAAVAHACGNTIRVNHAFHFALRLVALLLFYALLRRGQGPGRSFLLSLVAGIPTLLPFNGVGAYNHIEYISVEVVILLAVFVLDEPPDRRGVWRCRAIGALLGLLQWVKFGGAVVAGFAILAADGLWLLRARPRGEVGGRWLVGLGNALAVFLLLEALFAGLALGLCPPVIAREAIWPAYMIADYAKYGDRWPVVEGWRYFAGFQVLPLSCLILGVGALARDLGRRAWRPSRGELGAAVGLAFFAVGLLVYFKHRWLIYQYSWTVVPAGCLAVGRLPPRARVAVLAIWSPALAAILEISLLARVPASLVPYPLSTSEVIAVDRESVARLRAFERVAARVRAVDSRRSVLYVHDWRTCGTYHFAGTRPPLRNLFLVPHGFRPHDDREFLERLDLVGAFVWSAAVDPRAEFRDTFSGPLRKAIFDQFEEADVGPEARGLVTALIRRDRRRPATSTGR